MVKVLYGELKWGFIPVKRVVEDIPVDNFSIEPEISSSSSSEEKKENIIVHTDEKDDENIKSIEKLPVLTDTNGNIIEYEYRDEANRKWWKFFDEQEYSIPVHIRKQKKKWHWFEPNTSRAEKKLLIKLDMLLAFYSCMAYWVKNLDSSNLNNAYVSGMKEDLGMKGSDLTNMQNISNIGNIVFQLPFLFIIYKCPFNYILPVLDIIWSLFTIGAAKSQTVTQLKVCRFFVGSAEAPAYLAYQYLFGSFYQSTELVRRSMFYYFGQYSGVLSASGLQSSLYQYGTATFHGWRVAFLVDGCISLVVGLIGLYCIPGNDPYNIYSIFLSDDEIRLLRKRTSRNVFKASENFWDHKKWRKILSEPKIYVFCLFNIFLWCCSSAGSGSYLLWLKSLNEYSIPKLNHLAMGAPGIGFVLLTVFGLYADLFKSKYQAIILSQVLNFISNIILCFWNSSSKTAKFFAFNTQYSAWAGAPASYMFMAASSRDSDERSKILVTSNILAETFNVISNTYAFNSADAPKYKHGFPFAASMAVCLSLSSLLVLYIFKKQERAFARKNGIILYNSKTGENYPLDKEEA